MLLIADSGSTKTDWRLISSQGNEYSFHTQGFNPYFQTSEAIAASIKYQLIEKLPVIPSTEKLVIAYYGAGCSTPQKKQVVEEALTECFPNTDKIEVYHDLLAACHALCAQSSGIVGILGTGSNSCYYDGNEIISNVPSLGFMLGDEGSGAHIGKKLLTQYLQKSMPQLLQNEFFREFNYTTEQILDKLYNQPLPNRFLASFTTFAGKFNDDPYIRKVLKESFIEFIQNQISHYKQYQTLPVNLVGSVAFYFQDIIKEVFESNLITIAKIQASPMNGLVAYQLKFGNSHNR